MITKFPGNILDYKNSFFRIMLQTLRVVLKAFVQIVRFNQPYDADQRPFSTFIYIFTSS